MAWVRIDDSFPDHPKAVQAGPMACWLYVCGIAYANRFLTDGFIPNRQIWRLVDCDGVDDLAASLVGAGLWEVADGGYQIHDYLDYQSSAEKVKSDREATRKRVEAHRNRESGKFSDKPNVTPLHQRYDGVSNGDVTTAPHTYTHTDTQTSQETPTPREKGTKRTKTGKQAKQTFEYPAWFEDVWRSYPNKANKYEAFLALEALGSDEPFLDKIKDAIAWQRRSDQWTKDGGRFVPMMTTWLNKRRWEDSPSEVLRSTGKSQMEQQMDVIAEVFGLDTTPTEDVYETTGVVR